MPAGFLARLPAAATGLATIGLTGLLAAAALAFHFRLVGLYRLAEGS